MKHVLMFFLLNLTKYLHLMMLLFIFAGNSIVESEMISRTF